MNLLPLATRRRQAIRRALRLWAYVAAGAMLLLIGLTLHQEQLTSQVEERLAQSQQAYDLTHADLQNTKSLRREIDELTQRHGAALSLTEEGPALALLGLLSQAAASNSDGVAIEHFSLFTATVGQSRNSLTAGPSLQIELRGVAANPVALAEFVSAIRNCPAFTRVDLKSTSEIQIRQQSARRFILECAQEGAGT